MEKAVKRAWRELWKCPIQAAILNASIAERTQKKRRQQKGCRDSRGKGKERERRREEKVKRGE